MNLENLQADVARFFTCQHEQMSRPMAELFAQAHPKKILRAELLRHLHASGWEAQQDVEFSRDGIKRYLDIVVFDGGGAEPLCVIELMHQDARRSGTWALTGGMDADYHLFRPEIPLMQLAVYTVMTKRAGQLDGQGGQHGRGGLGAGSDDAGLDRISFSKCLTGWSERRQWIGQVAIGTTATRAFSECEEGTTEGFVEYFIGIRKSRASSMAAMAGSGNRSAVGMPA